MTIVARVEHLSRCTHDSPPLDSPLIVLFPHDEGVDEVRALLLEHPVGEGYLALVTDFAALAAIFFYIHLALGQILEKFRDHICLHFAGTMAYDLQKLIELDLTGSVLVHHSDDIFNLLESVDEAEAD